MTLHNQMAPSDKTLPMGVEELTEVLRRYEQAVEAAEGSVAEPMSSGSSPEAHDVPDTEALHDLHTITVVGVQLTVDPTVFDDFELLESLAEIQRGDILSLPTVFRAVVGDQAQALLDAVRDERGRVTATAATEMLLQIMRELAPKA